MKWRYSPCAGNCRTGPAGSTGTDFRVVEAGQAAPEEVMSRWVAGSGYAVCVDFSRPKQINAGAMNGKAQR